MSTSLPFSASFTVIGGTAGARKFGVMSGNVASAGQRGSMPHSLVNFFSNSAASEPKGTAAGFSVTPSSSPAPDENHGRSMYTRKPPQRREDFAFGSAPLRIHWNSGTMYSGFGLSGRAELRMSAGVGIPASAPVGRTRFFGSAVTLSGKYSRNLVDAAGVYVTA